MTFRSGGDVVAESLVAAGVTHTFGVPGEQWLGILDAIGRRGSDLTFVSTRHEGGAANMAEAFGKLTGRPAAVFGTAGVGAAHLAIGVHTARQDSTPLVVIIGQVRTAFRHREAWQEIEVADVFRTMAKHTVEIREPDRIAELLPRAIDIAVSGRPGPVVVSVPENLQSGPSGGRVRRRAPITPPALSPDVADQILGLVASASRPVVVAGGGIRLAGAREELVRFADSTGVPVVLGWRRSDSFPNDHPRYAGQLGLGGLPAVMDTVLGADLLLALGTRLPQVSTRGYAFPTRKQDVVHLDTAPESLVNQPFAARIAAVADPRAALRELNSRARPLGEHARAWAEQRVQEYRRQREADAATRPEPGARKLAEVARQVDELLPDDGVVTCDAGDFSGPFAVNLQFRGARRFLGPTSGSMAYALPAAVGAKSADPTRTVVALCGDGGFMMAVQELETAVRYRLPVVVLVCNNNRHGSIARHQRASWGGRLFGTELGNPRFAELADTFGAAGYSVEDSTEFRPVFAEALHNDVPSVIEVRM